MTQCAASTKSGRRCRRKAAAESEYCGPHAGSSPTPAVELTDETKVRITDLLRAGVPSDVAAQVAGVPFALFTEWLKAGAAGDPAYAEFASDVEVARGEGETRYIAQIAQHAKKDWRAGAWMLPRLNPDRYGPPPQARPPDRPERDGPHATDQAGL